MKRIVIILLVFLAAACQKEELEVNQTPDRVQVRQHLGKVVPKEVIDELDWSKYAEIEQGDKLLAVKIPFLGTNPADYQFVIVDIDNGQLGTVYKNNVHYKAQYGYESFPTYISNYNYGSHKLKEYNLSEKAEPTIGALRRILPRTLVAPGSTLPMVTIVGSYSNGGTGTSLNSTTAYILAGMLGMDGSGGSGSGEGTGGGDGSSNDYTNLDYLDPLYTGDAGSTTTVEPEIITWELDESDSKEPIDLEKFLKCFDALPSTNATYSVKVYVDIPVNKSPDVLIGTDQSTGEFGPGHVFLRISKFVNGQQMSQVIGFYPRHGLKSATMNPVASKMVNDGNALGIQHQYNASMTIDNWSNAEFTALLGEIKKNSMKDYELDAFNCANFVASSVNAIKPGLLSSAPVLVYDPTNSLYNNTVVPFSPNGMYKALQAEKAAGGPNASKIEVGVNVKSLPGNGPCN